MYKNIQSIITAMLKIDIPKKDLLVNQIHNIQYEVDKIENHYIIIFEAASALEENMNGNIRMDSFSGLHEVFTFELSILEGRFQTLKVSKHDDTNELSFEWKEIILERMLLSYDVTFFKQIEFLPVGTIVSLKEGMKKMMIYGRDIQNGTDNKKYEYIGCFYPEGVRDFNRVFLFDSTQIKKVHWLGMQGIEEDKYMEMMAKGEPNE